MKGILLKERLWKATIAGEKTQTRRLVKPPKGYDVVDLNLYAREVHAWRTEKIESEKQWKVLSPRYKVGEVVYIKEPYAEHDEFTTLYKFSTPEEYRSSYKWNTPLFMRASDAQHCLLITSVKAQRLNSMTEQDAIAEGFDSLNEFNTYWDELHDQEAYKVAANPVVFAYEYTYARKINYSPDRKVFKLDFPYQMDRKQPMYWLDEKRELSELPF